MIDQLKRAEKFIIDKLYTILKFAKFIFIPQRKSLQILVSVFVVLVVFFSGRYLLAAGAAASDPTFMGQDTLDWLIKFFNRLLFLIAYALGWIAAKLFALVVVISGYNDFVTSPAVNKGWVLVRDVCNMAFVLVLLVIAFGRILGLQGYSDNKYLVGVIKAAILVNFSKLICGLMIDFAQVVMMTFVNGYQATAGANLVVGLGLNRMLDFNEESRIGGGAAIAPQDIFVALALGIAMLICTIFVVFFIAVLLLIRIVYIWILVVFSPAAFLLSEMPFGRGYFTQWWGIFSKYVMIGPIMAFLLWLSLLVMSNPAEIYQQSADIESKSDKPIPMAVGTYNNIIQFAIGLAMLAGSLIAAQQAGGVIGKQAGAALTRGKAYAARAGKAAARPVTARAGAVAAGYRVGREAKKRAWEERIGAKYGKVGGAAFRLTEQPTKLAKQGAAVISQLPRVAVAGGARLVGQKEYAKQSWAKAGYNIKTSGSLEASVIASTKAGEMKKDRDVATEKLKTAGILKDPAQMQQMLELGMGSVADRKVAAMKLAEKGNITNMAQANAGRKALAKDEEALDAFQASIKKKQAQLAYDLSTDKGRKDFRADDEIDHSKQSKEFYEDKAAMKESLEKFGADAFAKVMEKVPDRGAEFKTAITSGMKDAMKEIIPKLKSESTTGSLADRATAKAKLDEVRKATAKVTGNMGEAFGKRGPGTNLVLPGQFEPAEAKQMNDYLDSASTKELARVEINNENVATIAPNISMSAITQMASSNQGGNSIPNVRAVLDKLVAMNIAAGPGPLSAEIVKKLKQAAKSDRVMASIKSPATRTHMENLP
ncbi:hypothetical protein KKC32_03605 [Patescibacteria group bacterium]|nr:hypothetical protein [Patescibacteria group bacterium]